MLNNVMPLSLFNFVTFVLGLLSLTKLSSM